MTSDVLLTAIQVGYGERILAECVKVSVFDPHSELQINLLQGLLSSFSILEHL